MIVAHAAGIALADDQRALRVLVTASPHVRAQRLWPGKMISTLRKPKSASSNPTKDVPPYFRRFYKISCEQPTHYDLVVNTDRLSPESVAAVISATATGTQLVGNVAAESD